LAAVEVLAVADEPWSGCVEPPPFVPLTAIFGAVAAAWAASTPTPASEASVMTTTEYVAPRPGFFGC
jgi:hypothetical protein